MILLCSPSHSCLLSHFLLRCILYFTAFCCQRALASDAPAWPRFRPVPPFYGPSQLLHLLLIALFIIDSLQIAQRKFDWSRLSTSGHKIDCRLQASLHAGCCWVKGSPLLGQLEGWLHPRSPQRPQQQSHDQGWLF